MVKLKTLAVLTLGILIGAIGSALWIGSDLITPAPRLAVADLSKSAPNSTFDLGRLMMARIAKSFVADSRSQYPSRLGITFFASPRPFGDFLCSVDVYNFNQRIVHGSALDVPQYWDGGLDIATQFGLNSELDATRKNLSDFRCLGYKDFKHLIYGVDGGVVERGVRLLALAKRQELDRSAAFKISCLDGRPEPEKAPANCDGAALLRETNLKQIRRVYVDRENKDRTGADHVDIIDMIPTPGGCLGGADTLMFVISSRETYGRQSSSAGDIREVYVERDHIC
jgi:hypothetical protein